MEEIKKFLEDLFFNENGNLNFKGNIFMFFISLTLPFSIIRLKLKTIYERKDF